MPTSITDGARLDPVALDQPGAPDGGDEHVGAAAHLGEVARARVADRSRSRWRRAAARRPACRRGRSARRRPPRRPRARRRGGAAAPSRPTACTAAGPGRPLASRPGGDRREAVDVLARVDQRRSAPAPSTWAGVGSWSRIPRHARVGVELAQERARPRRAARRAGEPVVEALDADLGATPSACRRRRPPTPGRRRRARWPGRARRGPPRPSAATSSRDLARAPAARSPCRR